MRWSASPNYEGVRPLECNTVKGSDPLIKGNDARRAREERTCVPRSMGGTDLRTDACNARLAQVEPRRRQARTRAHAPCRLLANELLRAVGPHAGSAARAVRSREQRRDRARTGGARLEEKHAGIEPRNVGPLADAGNPVERGSACATAIQRESEATRTHHQS